MRGWLYLIKNGDLYKIGITKNLDSRMRQLKPDSILAKLYSTDFKQLEREFHKRYKNVRIPQTEYFRLDDFQIKDIKQRISKLSYPMSITFWIFIKSIYLLLLLFLFLVLIISLFINDINDAILISLLCMDRISFGLSFISVFFKSKKYLSLFNELKYRSTRFIVLFLFAFIFRYTYRFIF